jgi:hypothetical protein
VGIEKIKLRAKKNKLEEFEGKKERRKRQERPH